MADLVARKRPVRPLSRVVERAAADVMQVERVRHVIDRLKAIGLVVDAGQDAKHARHARRARTVDAQDARVRVRRAYERAPRLSCVALVVGVTAPAGQQPVVLKAG